MPNRMIRDELLTSERFWKVSAEARCLFIGIILCADDTARYTGSNFALRTKCMAGTVDSERVERMLSELVDVDLVRAYVVDGARYVFIPRSRQRMRYTNSRYPAPPNGISDLIEEKTALRPSQVGPKPVLGPSQDGRSEEKRREEKKRETRASRFSLPSLPDDWAEYCKQKRSDLDPAKVFEAFSDFWRAKAGKDGTKLDWFATWRTWVRNEKAGKAVSSQPDDWWKHVV